MLYLSWKNFKYKTIFSAQKTAYLVNMLQNIQLQEVLQLKYNEHYMINHRKICPEQSECIFLNPHGKSLTATFQNSFCI